MEATITTAALAHRATPSHRAARTQHLLEAHVAQAVIAEAVQQVALSEEVAARLEAVEVHSVAVEAHSEVAEVVAEVPLQVLLAMEVASADTGKQRHR